MLIILEGADGSGKTTLMKQLLEKGYMCKKLLRNEGSGKVMQVYNEGTRKDRLLVIDRSFISDMVYRCNDNKPREDVDAGDAIYILNNSKIVYCKTYSQYEDSMARGEDNITSKEDARQIAKTYDLFMTFFRKYTDVKIFEYDWHCQDADDVVNFIQEDC